jgi:hypothetical protein
MAASEDRNLQGPGDFSLEYLDIITSKGEIIHIKDHGWLSISLTEDIFEPAVMGVIDIMDSVDLPGSYNLIGNETIEFNFSTPSLTPIKFEGKCTKVTESIDTSDASKGYSLEFISAEAITSMLNKVRKSYSDMPYSEMAKLIYKDYIGSDKPFDVEGTLNTSSLTIPGWSPFRALTSLADRSQSSNPNYQNGSFLFYETCIDDTKMYGGFKFHSLESLWDKSRVMAHYTNQVKNVTQGDPVDYKAVKWYTEKARMDTIENIRSGMYASKVITHDLVKRKVYSKKYNYKENFKKTVSLNRGGAPLTDSDLYTSATGSYEMFMPKQYQSYGGEYQGTTLPEHTLMNRTSIAQQLNNQILEISISGDSERRVGDIVSFSLPAAESVGGDDDPKWDKYLTGKYLVTAVTHKVMSTPESYETILELTKESIQR